LKGLKERKNLAREKPETKAYVPRLLLPETKKQLKRKNREIEQDEKFQALKLAWDLASKDGIPRPTNKSLHGRIIDPNLQELIVDNDIVGAIIGAKGTRLNKIREYSGAKIKLFPPMENTSLRQIHVAGGMMEIQMAIYLINCCNDLYSGVTDGGMNNPFEQKADGTYKSALGEWLASTNQKKEDQLVLKAFFASYEQSQKQKAAPIPEEEADTTVGKIKKRKKKKKKSSKRKRAETVSDSIELKRPALAHPDDSHDDIHF